MIRLVVILSTLFSYINGQCSQGKIYNILTQSCLPCSSNCSDCYNTGTDQCTLCGNDSLKSYSNTSTCVQRCAAGEFQIENKSCIKCLVEGCTKCDSSQNCLECNGNLEIDLSNNKCRLKQNFCDSELDLIYQPFTSNQCVKSCPPKSYYNQLTQICEKTVYCTQIDSSSMKLSQRVQQVTGFFQNQYIFRANQCNFALVDKNLEVIDVQILQDVSNFEQNIYSPGQELPERSFILGKYGGCQVNKTLVVMDFEARQVIFEKNGLNQDYRFIYFDPQNQLVFLKSVAKEIAWFDIVSLQLEIKPFEYISISLIFQIQNGTNTNYYFQANLNNPIKVASFQQDRQLNFLQQNLTSPDKQIIIQSYQKEDYQIAVYFDLSNLTIQKLVFSNETNFQSKIIQAEPSSYSSQFLIYYSYLLNTIIYYDQLSNNLKILGFSQFCDEIDFQYIITSQPLNSIKFLEDSQTNNTFMFWVSNKLQFVNLTEYAIKYKAEKTNQTNTLLQTINSPQITSQSTITSVIFQKDNVIEIFITQILEINSYYYQQIRIQLNLKDGTFLVKYLYPNLNFKPFYLQFKQQLTISPSQRMFSLNDLSQKNYFFIQDELQTYSSPVIGVQKIQFQLLNMQKNPRLNTRLMGLQIEDDFDEIKIIGEKYFLIRKVIGYSSYESIISIATKKKIISYTITFFWQNEEHYYIKKRNLLILTQIPQIYNLDTGESLIQNPTDLLFYFQNFIIINDDYLLLITTNDYYEYVLLQIDLQTSSVTQLYNFGYEYEINFLKIKNHQPILVFNDLIYICFEEVNYFIISYTDCQTFSLSQQKFINEKTKIAYSRFINRQLSFKETGEIFIFYENTIFIYSYDLSQQQALDLDINYPNLNNELLELTYNDRYVFYFDQNYFFRFDMKLKQFSTINAITELQLYTSFVFDFYALDEDSYYLKKSQNIIDTSNMITINVLYESCNYIGSFIVEDNNQIHCFSSEKGVFWYLNLFNTPFNVINISQDQKIQDNSLQNNKIAIYDKSNSQLIIYHTQKTNEIKQISIDFEFDFTLTMVDWEKITFIWIKDKSVYQYDESQKQQQIATFNTNILEYEYCFDQKTIVVKYDQMKIQIIQIDLNIMLPEVNEIKYYVNCEESIIVLYYPLINVFELATGEPSQDLQQQISMLFNKNPLKMVPLVRKKDQLLIAFLDKYSQSFLFKQFRIFQFLFDYRVNSTELFYDIDDQILIGTSGMFNQINIINIPGSLQLFTYQTTNQFNKNAVYFYQDQKSLIIVDSTPSMYLCNYLTQNITVFNIDKHNYQGVQMDESKNIIFLYSNQFILTFSFPKMQFIEAISLQQYSDTDIQKIFVNSQQSLLTVQTQSHILCFDLTEIIYATETNLLQHQKIQSLNLNQQYQVIQSIVNHSLNLYYNAQLLDTLLMEPSKYNVYPYFQQLILMQGNQFIFISYEQLNIIQADLKQQKLILIQNIGMNKTPDNYFYDIISNQIFLFYEQNNQLSKIGLNAQKPEEKNLTNFIQGDIQQSLIFNNYIIAAYTNSIQIYDFIQNQTNQINFASGSLIKTIFKLQIKSFNDYSTNWWDVPFDSEERYNNNDLKESLLFLIIQNQNNLSLQIANIQTNQIVNTYEIQYSKITNASSDPFRKLVFLVNDQGQTLVFTYSLSLIVTLQNACLKQAKILFDSDYIYSICPNDIIIYNGLSLEQQFQTINHGINEVENFVNMKYSNFFLIIQKEKFYVIKMMEETYEIIYNIDKSYQQLIFAKINKDENELDYLELLFSSYDNIQHSIIPLQQTQTCSINIQQKERSLESLDTIITLSQSLQSLQSSNQKLSLIQIQYTNGQCIQGIDYNQIKEQNIDQNYQINLVSFADSQNVSVCWEARANIPSQIQNFYLKNMKLSILSEINLNEKKFMTHFQMNNITLSIQKSLVLSNFDKVILYNITFNNQIQGLNQIIINNCELVFIQLVDLTNIQAEQIIFTISNNTKVIIQQVRITNSNGFKIFQLINNQQIKITDIQIIESSEMEVIQVLQVKQIIINNIIISQIQQSTILNIQGATSTEVKDVVINNSSYVQFISIQPLLIEEFQILSQQYSLQNMNLTDSSDIQFNSQTKNLQISNVNIKNLTVTTSCFQLMSEQIKINQIDLQNSQSIANQQFSNQALILIFNYYNSLISNINSLSNKLAVLYINQQGYFGNTILQSCKFIGFTLKNSLISLLNLDNVFLNQIQVKNVILSDYSYSSILLISQSSQVVITGSEFSNNTNSNGYGGSIYLVNNFLVQIKSTLFEFNNCLQLNGGAFSVYNSMKVGSLLVSNSQFNNNTAKLSTGGAINLINSNLILQNTNITDNEALIGGGIYYSQIVPDFILDLNYGIDNGNIITANIAKFYGKNLGSSLRKIFIDLADIFTSRNSTVSLDSNGVIQIRSFKSGDQIGFEKIQFLDEENNPLQISSMALNVTSYSSDVQILLNQLSSSLSWDIQNIQVQCIGEVQSKQFIDNGLKLNAQITYKPLSQTTIQIISNSFPQLKDSKGNIYLQQNNLYKNITFYFDGCQLGQIVKQQSDSIICEDCPEGKYSLDLQDPQCLVCPDTAVKCYSSTILLKNGHWRENNLTDFIISCNFNPEACQPESSTSLNYCKEGYKGPLCQTCDTYGEIWGKSYSELFSNRKCYNCEQNLNILIIQNLVIFLVIFYYIFIILKNIINKLQAKLLGYFVNKSGLLFLGSTLIQSDKPQIVSKILTDHLQILSLISYLTINVPSYLNQPIQLSGNSLSVTSKSIDCVLSTYPNLKPLWFYQFLWSLVLPIFLIILYLVIATVYKLLKKSNSILRYITTSWIFIYLYFFPMVITLLSRSLNCIQIGGKMYLDLDITIRCFDSQNHKPFIIFFTLPLIVFWVLIIPLYLFYKIKKGINNKWSIFIENKYSFIFAGYKNKFFYWEFGKLVFKSVLILVSILFQQNELLKVSLMNAVILSYMYVTFKCKPFVIRNFNTLLQKSALICSLSLNITSIISQTQESNDIQRVILMLILIFPNLKFIVQLIIGICLIQIPKDEYKRSKLQKFIYSLKLRYPYYFENIQIQSDLRMKSLLKLKEVKKKIKMLAGFLKNYSLYDQESLQQHFSLSKTQVLNGSSSPTEQVRLIQTQQIDQSQTQRQASSQKQQYNNSKFQLQAIKNKQNMLQRNDSFKNMRDKWNYYTRRTKNNSINQKNLESQEDYILDNINQQYSYETSHFQTENQNENNGTELISEIQTPKQYNFLLTQNENL